MKHLLTIEELKTIGRPIGKVSEDKLNAFISEAEHLHIKPILGDDLFLALLSEVSKEDEESTDTDKKMLLDGGTYYINRGCENEQIRSFLGLKVTIAYYVYAQNLMVGDVESTRYGSVVKSGEYSDRLSSKERSDAYNNTLEVANSYLKECVDYCKAKGLIKTPGKSNVAIGGVRIKRIG